MKHKQSEDRTMLTARQTLQCVATCLLLTGLFSLSASAQLTSTPISLAYGTVYLGTISTSKSVTIKNTGLTSVTITAISRSEEHTSELQSHLNLVCRLLLEKKKFKN